ncbi:hypothetical protein LXA43DRAFT_1087517 [Ganoderma leucocontextum]|nr:hypothetical protein LXA43DRAFT_1087517 [Ganoderma leucocontextum]
MSSELTSSCSPPPPSSSTLVPSGPTGVVGKPGSPPSSASPASRSSPPAPSTSGYIGPATGITRPIEHGDRSALGARSISLPGEGSSVPPRDGAIPAVSGCPAVAGDAASSLVVVAKYFVCENVCPSGRSVECEQWADESGNFGG